MKKITDNNPPKCQTLPNLLYVHIFKLSRRGSIDKIVKNMYNKIEKPIKTNRKK